MKSLFSVFALALSMPAFAVYAPNWERPIEEAQMEIVEADGFFEGAQDVAITLNRRDGSKKKATSLSLEMLLPNSQTGAMAPLTHLLTVNEIAVNDQGEMLIRASAKLYDENAATGYFPTIEVDLKRIPCTVLTKASTQWKAVVRFIERGSVTSLSTMSVKGLPEALMTIQSLALE